MRCPFCKRENPDGAKFCIGCGRFLKQENTMGDGKMKPYSGSSLPDGKKTDSGRPLKEQNGMKAVMISAAAVIIIGAAAAVVLILSGNNTNTDDESLVVSAAVDVSLGDFAADEVSFAAGREHTITFTVSATGDPDSVTLLRDNEAVAAMFDNGESGDAVAGDGVYTAVVSFLEDTASQYEYTCVAGEVISESVMIYAFLEPSEKVVLTETSWDAQTFEELHSGGEEVSLKEISYQQNPDSEGGCLSEFMLYEEILERFYYGISTQWEGYEDNDDMICFLWYAYGTDRSLSDSGFAFIDLDGDGTKEMLVDVYDQEGRHGCEIRDLYMYRDGRVIHLASGGERWNYWLCADHTIGYKGSGGAYAGSYEYYAVSPDTDELVLLHYLEYEYRNDNPVPDWYYTDDENVAYYSSTYGPSPDLIPISDDEAQEIMDAYEEMDYDLTPFSEYTPS